MVENEHRMGVEPTRAGDVGLAPRGVALPVGRRRPVAPSLHQLGL